MGSTSTPFLCFFFLLFLLSFFLLHVVNCPSLTLSDLDPAAFALQSTSNPAAGRCQPHTSGLTLLLSANQSYSVVVSVIASFSVSPLEQHPQDVTSGRVSNAFGGGGGRGSDLVCWHFRVSLSTQKKMKKKQRIMFELKIIGNSRHCDVSEITHLVWIFV